MENPVKVFWYCEKWQPGGIQRVQVNLLPYFDSKEIRMDLAFSEDGTPLFDGKIAAAGYRLDAMAETPREIYRGEGNEG
ncbi:MAG: hypothetical protein IKH57_06220 [Clostridia bacterium]|nr:hypothetical protein [Clostridia bacterium]